MMKKCSIGNIHFEITVFSKLLHVFQVIDITSIFDNYMYS